MRQAPVFRPFNGTRDERATDVLSCAVLCCPLCLSPSALSSLSSPRRRDGKPSGPGVFDQETMRADGGNTEAYFASYGFLRARRQLSVMSKCLYRAFQQGTRCFQLPNIFQSLLNTHTGSVHARAECCTMWKHICVPVWSGDPHVPMTHYPKRIAPTLRCFNN